MKDNLTADAFVRVHACDYDRGIVRASGTRQPSSESMLHVTRREDPFGSVALVRRVLEILDDHTFIVMRNHGFLALGVDMESAGQLALRVHGECLR